MNTLLTAIMLWLTCNFDLPVVYERPRVEFVPAVEITLLRYGPLLSAEKRHEVLAQYRNNMAMGEPREVVAVYIDTTKTIFLPEEWTGDSPAELSILVHEMVHHLQNLAGEKFACLQERETLAYAAQNRWLGLFGHDLERDFKIDPMTLLVSTHCVN
jgi:hypothetical protein